jgi:surface protein
MSSLFEGKELFDDDLTGWDVSAVKSMERMFYGCTNFNGDVSTWNTENVEDMEDLFFRATAFDGNLTSWNTSRVTTMSGLFCELSRSLFYGAHTVSSPLIFFCHQYPFRSSLSIQGNRFGELGYFISRKSVIHLLQCDVI